jgi:hypothetical protein
MPQRRRLITGVALCITVMAAASIDTAILAQADRDSAAPREPRVVAESRFVVTNAPAQTDLVQLVVDFEPSAWTSLHTHGGQAINLVLEGEITLRRGGMDRRYKGWAVVDRQYQPGSRGRQYWIWQSPVAHEFSTAEGRASNHGRAGISIWTGGHL